MAGELVAEVLIGAVRVVGQLLFEVGFEILVRGAGYLICRPFSRRVDMESGTVATVGVVFWLLLAAGAYWAWR